MALTRRGEIWHYHFYIRGQRFRGSTGERKKSAAAYVEAQLRQQARAAALHIAVPGKAPLLRELSTRFFHWVDGARLSKSTKRYYRLGWDQLKETDLAGVRIDRITNDQVEPVQFAGGPSNANNAIRTLRRMLGKAEEWRLITAAPRLKLHPEHSRELLLDDDAEARLLAVARQPLKDVIILMRDTGLRNESEVLRLRIENIDWMRKLIFNPKGKTARARRWLPMSDRVFALLRERCAGRSHGWVFTSKRSPEGRRTTVAKQFREARDAAKLPSNLVLYCARHSFGTEVYSRTKNLKLVMDSMGHADVRTAMRYQHPELEQIRDVLNERSRKSVTTQFTTQ